MEQKTALIEYVGRQINRGDDVLKTNRRWERAGSVVEVPEDQKHHYLAHVDEWREISRAELAARAVAREKASGALNTFKEVWSQLTDADLADAKAEIEAEIKRRAEESKKAPPVRPTGATPSLSDADESSQKAAADKVRQIAKAISEMDRNDDEQFSKTTGKPKVGVVSERVGFKVLVSEIDDALKLLTPAA